MVLDVWDGLGHRVSRQSGVVQRRDDMPNIKDQGSGIQEINSRN
jgi:hypothetical protein